MTSLQTPKREVASLYETPPPRIETKTNYITPHTLSFPSFSDVLHELHPSPPGFPNLSPMTPSSPTYCRVDTLTELPFDGPFDHSTLSANSSFSRPLPDQSAFESTFGRSSPTKCPPTPVRQPFLTRKSSLNKSKVLLTLPNFDLVDNPGKEIMNEFESHGWLGSGQFADVYKMKSRLDGKFYAIKKSKQPFRSKRDRARLLQEIRIYEKLATYWHHPCQNILQYYRAWQECGYFYIQTELCECGSINDLMKKLEPSEYFPEATIWDLAQDLACGLDYIHTANVVHLDIKPQNVFLSKEGIVKIGDFGTAVELGDVEEDAEGDTIYMAKELLQSTSIDPAADIFSAGIMLFQLASKCFLPQDGKLWHELRDGHSPRIPLCYSDELDQMIRQMMHPNPKKRPTARDIRATSKMASCGRARDTFIYETMQKSRTISPGIRQNLFPSIEEE